MRRPDAAAAAIAAPPPPPSRVTAESWEHVGNRLFAGGNARSQRGLKKQHRDIIKGIDAGATVHAGIKAELFSKATDSEEEKGKRPRSKNATAHVPGKHV